MDTLKLEIKQLLIDTLDLEDMTPADIDDDAPLFDTNGVGLDSIDALEIGIMLKQRYQLTLMANDERAHTYFRSINTLVELIRQHGSGNADGVSTMSEGAQ